MFITNYLLVLNTPSFLKASTLWKYIKNETIIFSCIKTPKNQGSGFIAGKINNPLYKGKFRISLLKLD